MAGKIRNTRFHRQPNKTLLRKTLKAVKKEAEKTDGAWYQSDWRISTKRTACGTAMCFAGWAAHLADVEWGAKDPNARWGQYVLITPEEVQAIEEWNARKDNWYRIGVERIPGKGNAVHVQYFARLALGLDGEAGDALFSASNTLPVLQRRVEKALDGELSYANL